MKIGNRQYDRSSLIRWVAFTVLAIGSAFIAVSLYQLPYDDLPSFYWATRLTFDTAVSPYQPEYFQVLGKELNQKIYPFLYPPPSLIVFSPFLLVDYSHAKVILSLLNLVLWWLLAWTTYRFYCAFKSVEHDTVAAVVIFLFLLLFIPLIDTIRTGQVNLIVIACLIPLMCDSQKTSAQLCTGVLLAVAIVLKVYLLLLLPLTLVFRTWRILFSALATLVLLCMVSLLCMPTGVWGDWVALSQQGAGYGRLMPYVMTLPWNQSLNGFLLRLASGHDVTGWYAYWPSMLYLVAIALAASVYFAAEKCRMKKPCGLAIAVSMVLALVNVIAPLTWLHHFVFMVPAIVSGICLAESVRGLKIALLVMACILGSPVLTNLLLGIPWPWPASGQVGFVDNLTMSVPLVAAIFMLMALLWLAQKGNVSN